MRSNHKNSELQKLMKGNKIFKNKMQHNTINHITNLPNNEQNMNSVMKNEINELKEMVKLNKNKSKT